MDNSENENLKNNTIKIDGNVSGVQIQQNTLNSTQNQAVKDNFDYDSMSNLLSEILKYKPFFRDTFGDETDKIIETLNKISIAVVKKEQPSKINKLFGVVKDISLRVTSSVISSGIVSLLAQIGI